MGADVVSKAVNKCRKEHQSLECKCELARGKIDLEQGQNQRYMGPLGVTIGRVVSHVSWTYVWSKLYFINIQYFTSESIYGWIYET